MGWGNPKVIDWVDDIRALTTPAMNFVGYYDAHITYNYGDAVVLDGIVCIYDGRGNWQELGDCPNFSEPKHEIKQYINCPNCGAPMHNHHCDYCGTEC